MSSIIDFLERMGSEAHLRDASLEELELVLTEAEIEAPLSTAILSKDTSGLQALMRQMPLFSIQLDPDEDEEDDEGDEKDGPKSVQRNESELVAVTSH
jgi:hypothetical protein